MIEGLKWMAEEGGRRRIWGKSYAAGLEKKLFSGGKATTRGGDRSFK